MSAEDLRAYGDRVVDRLLRENEHRWSALQPDDRVRVEALAREVAARLLAGPACATDPVHEQAVNDLFALGQPRSASPSRRTRAST